MLPVSYIVLCSFRLNLFQGIYDYSDLNERLIALV